MCTSKGARSLLHLMLYMFLALGTSTAKADELVPQWLSNEIYCLARVIYGEARGLPEFAQLDVAYSVMNRVALDRKDFGGNTVCGAAFHVIKRPDGVLVKQYTSIEGKLADAWQPGTTDKEWAAWARSLERAWRVYTGREIPSDIMKDALYYMNPVNSTKHSIGWFKRNLIPLVWSDKHLFFAER